MDRSLLLLALGLFFGAGIGFVIAASNGITLDGHSHEQNTAGDMAHSHDNFLELPGDTPPPGLKITVLKDPVSGWNLRVMATNFRFAPARAGRAHVAGEGHAHVYVNGVKIARLYGEWMHLAQLPAGKARVEVVLNSNDHRPLASDGMVISAEQVVTSP